MAVILTKGLLAITKSGGDLQYATITNGTSYSLVDLGHKPQDLISLHRATILLEELPCRS